MFVTLLSIDEHKAPVSSEQSFIYRAVLCLGSGWQCSSSGFREMQLLRPPEAIEFVRLFF